MTSHDPFSTDNRAPVSQPVGPHSDSQDAASTPALPVSTDRDGSGDRQVRLVPGAILSGTRYKIEKLLAAGGMGAVYRAIDTRFNRPCAVKEMLDNFHSDAERAQSLEWFEREATLLLDLNHPCIPRVRDFFAENGKHYIVMDLIDGRTLADVAEREGNVKGVNGAHGISEARARYWAQQICSVLDYLHHLNPPIIFRDLKPLNIMVTEGEKIKLIDFGIARTFQTQVQSTIIMTIGYAPPEQLGGRPEPRSDLYALGATLHKVLTHHDAAHNQPGIFNFPALRALRPEITAAFEQVIMKALNPTAEQRWNSAAEMERALMNLPPVTAPLTATGQPPTTSPLAPGTVSGQGSTPITTGSAPGRVTTSPQITSEATGLAGIHIRAALGHMAKDGDKQPSLPAHVDAAFEAVKQAYSLEPHNALVHKLFGQIFARRVPPQADLALNAYSRSLQLNPNDAETYKLVGDVSLYLHQKPQQAIAHYIQSLRLNPNDYEAHWRLGLCYEKANQLDAALREYQEAARLAPKHPSLLKLHATLGQLALRLNQLSVAEQAFVQLLILNPEDHQARFLLSHVYESQGQFELALRECRYVLGPLSTKPEVQQMYQRLCARMGR